jgi:16S rRNA (uracil1498-N3)-methyltransferase
MPRLIIPTIPSGETRITLRHDEARYLLTVLRMGPGGRVELIHDGGLRSEAVILAIDKSRADLEVTGQLAPIPEPPVRITLVQGVLKGAKMDLVIQKATELGVSAIAPVVTSRCEVRETRKQPRWEKIASEAARQSVQPRPPAILPVTGYAAFIASLPANPRGLVFWEEGGSPVTIADAPDGGEFIIIVGPEGGLTADEVALAAGAGLKVATLGPRTLRAETAAIAALSVAQFICGALGR